MTAEILQHCGHDALALLYKLIMADVQEQRIPAHWRQILYVLLTKPLPNNPELVHKRREIALMAQDMKAFLHMIRRTVHARMAGRINKAQMGGCTGYGATDVGLALELALQQAAILGDNVWVLYIDLATWFPKLDRRVCTFSNLVLGLPPVVKALTAKNFG